MEGESSNSDIPVVFLNQKNATSITPYGKERKMLNNGSLWHRVIVHNIQNMARENVLKIILNAVHPLDLIPVKYKKENGNAYFMARNCGPAIEKLCRSNLIVRNSEGKSFKLTVLLGFSNTTETQLNVQSNISQTIMKRFNASTKLLDLDGFHNDCDLSDLIFCILSQPKILYFVLHLSKPLSPTSLRLSNNELKILSPIEVLWSLKSLTCLDLRNNLIENMVSLTALKSMRITELYLDGNPVCQNYDELGYIQAVKEICPTLEKLDGIMLGHNGFLAYRRNFTMNSQAVCFVDQFLDHFFTLYDSKDRTILDGLYHSKAMFSLSSICSPGISRNLLKLSDMSKASEQLTFGAANIIRRFTQMPATEHDPYTFTIDIVLWEEKKSCVFTVTGAYRETSSKLQDTENLYGFSRMFVLVAGNNGEYLITNEMLNISSATDSLSGRAFKMVRVLKPNVTHVQCPTHFKEKIDMTDVFCKITGMKLEPGRIMLEQWKWDLKKTLEDFVEQYQLGRISQDLMYEELPQT